MKLAYSITILGMPLAALARPAPIEYRELPKNDTAGEPKTDGSLTALPGSDNKSQEPTYKLSIEERRGANDQSGEPRYRISIVENPANASASDRAVSMESQPERSKRIFPLPIMIPGSILLGMVGGVLSLFGVGAGAAYGVYKWGEKVHESYEDEEEDEKLVPLNRWEPGMAYGGS